MDIDVRFDAENDEIVTLFGESGSGKTTILRMIAGLTAPDEGYIELNDTTWFCSRKKINLPPQHRKTGFVPQESALFPNMSVEENLYFAMKNKTDLTVMHDLLALTDMTAFRHHKPDQLSGGQKQRISLVRAFLTQPEIFLFDEPFSALDIPSRLKLQDTLITIQKKFLVPAIFVSHDISEVFRLSKRMLCLENGLIKHDSNPAQTFGDNLISGKFRFSGVVLDICQDNFMYVVTVQIGNHLTKIAAAANEIDRLKIGDKIVVAAKAFNPLILSMP